MAKSSWCYFVLLTIQTSELLPTSGIFDNLQAEKDYRVENSYINEEHTHAAQVTTKISGRMKQNKSQTISTKNEEKDQSNINKNAEVFLQKIMKRRLKLKVSMANQLPTNSPDTTFVYHPVYHKNRREKTYRWLLLPSDNDNPFLAEYVEFGLNQWARVSKVNFKYVPYREDMDMSEFDILIKFERGAHGDDKPFDGPGGLLAHTIPGGPDDPDEKIEIHLDGDEDWKFGTGDYLKERPDETPDFIETIMHEAGHVLGFADSKNLNSTMHHPFRKKEDQKKNERFYPYYFLSHEDKQRVKKTHGRCSPPRIDAIFSFFRGNGQSYIFLGPYTYKIDQQMLQPFATINESYPRPSLHYWHTFEFIDEAFIHTDGNTYFFSGDKYAVNFIIEGKTQVIYKQQQLGKVSDQGHTYIGWPGLKHHRYIDAALVLFEQGVRKSYIFQDDFVYLWDSKKKVKENDQYHLPKGSVADGWPKKISEVFPGVPNNIDTAFHYYFNGKIYFFKDKFYYRWMPEDRSVNRKRIDYFFRNICNVYMCLPLQEGKSCRSWDMSRDQ